MRALKKIKMKYVLMFLDDFFLQDKVDQQQTIKTRFYTSPYISGISKRKDWFRVALDWRGRKINGVIFVKLLLVGQDIWKYLFIT